jgi:Domain of unknown function (DUF4145)
MPSIILECPHCGAEKIGFSIIAEHISVFQANPELRIHKTLMVCTKCEGGAVGVFEKRLGTAPQSIMQCGVDPTMLGFPLVDTYPKPAPTKIPDHVPSPLDRYYQQAADALKRSDWDASGAMSRKLIDVSTKLQLGADASKYRDNFARINALADRGSLTSDLRDWAHEIRIGGNEAVHDEDPFEESQAKDLINFADLYLVYVYTLPGRLRARRDRKELADAAKPN